MPTAARLASTDGTAGPLAEPVTVPAGLLDPAVQFRSAVIGAVHPGAMNPAEAALLPAHAVETRRREFAAGRLCAARAMAALGAPVRPVGVRADRSPAWPDGIVGSISHSRTLAIAVLAQRSSGILSIGADLEEDGPLERDLFREICVDAELEWLEAHPAEAQGRLAKAVFCAKEAAYKCQYPISRRLFGHHALRVDLDREDRRFTARFLEDASPFNTGDALRGRIWISGDHIVAVATLR